MRILGFGTLLTAAFLIPVCRWIGDSTWTDAAITGVVCAVAWSCMDAAREARKRRRRP